MILLHLPSGCTRPFLKPYLQLLFKVLHCELMQRQRPYMMVITCKTMQELLITNSCSLSYPSLENPNLVFLAWERMPLKQICPFTCQRTGLDIHSADIVQSWYEKTTASAVYSRRNYNPAAVQGHIIWAVYQVVVSPESDSWQILHNCYISVSIFTESQFNCLFLLCLRLMRCLGLFECFSR